jgi:hypothetical protein
MTLYVCGASFCTGQGLTDPANNWTNFLSHILNDNLVNSAINGGGFDYVTYKSTRDILINSYDKVIIMWPPLNRPLMVRRENNFLINGNSTMTNALYGQSKEFKNYLNLYYKYWINYLYDLKFSLQQMLSLQNVLKNKNIKYLFINTNNLNLSQWSQLSHLSAADKNMFLDAFDQMNNDQILDEEREINTYLQHLDLGRYYKPFTYNIYDDCVVNNLLDFSTMHPTEDGHRYIANNLYNIWNNIS